jgi:hypothetical protein
LFACFTTFEASKHGMRLGFRVVTDARDPSAGLSMRQPSDGMPSRLPGGALPGRQFTDDMPPRYSDGDQQPTDFPRREPGEFPRREPGDFSRREPSDFPRREVMPSRQPAYPNRPSGGRHRRAVPNSLPQGAPALVLAVPGADTDLTTGPAGEISAILRVDNPAVDVRAARIDGGGYDDPSDLRTVLTDAAAQRPDGGPCAIVIPLLATINPPVIRRLRAAVAASGVNAIVTGFFNSNAMIAEILHIRLAEAGLARADRVRLFSIVTAADGVLIATVGGPDGAISANVTSVLLAARLALPVITASLDGGPSLPEAAMRLKEMGVNRLAIAPCFIGPEATRRDLDALAIGTDYAAPIGAHSNIAKLAANAYGQALNSIEIPGEQD